MKIFDLIGMCLRNLFRRKFRTFLTVMGVVIGTCAIVVMRSLGIGIEISQEQYLSSMGDLTIIDVYGRGGGPDAVLDDDAIASFNALPNVEVATALFRYQPDNSYMTMSAGKKGRYEMWGASYTLMGVTPEALEMLGYKISEGEGLGEAGGKKFQMVWGSLVAYDFEDTKRKWPNNWISGWPDENGVIADPFFDPMTTEFTLNIFPSKEGAKTLEYPGEVVGMLESAMNDYETMYSAFVHIDDLKRFKAAYEKENNIKRDREYVEQYDNVKVKVNDIKNVAEVQATIEGWDFNCWSMESWREELEQNAQQIQLILGILGGVSLFVAAISITNTMIMSVYERTREIGVMKVLGCLVGDIRSVFLIEAGLIGFIGGVLGIGFSYLLSFLLNRFGGMLGNVLGGFSSDGAISVIPLWLVGQGMLMAVVIGLVAGFQPANRAVRISALEAIKTE